jgi:uncharacterized membrane protein YccC
MLMTWMRTSAVIFLGAALFIVGGCWSNSSNSAPITVPVEPNPPPTIETSTTRRVRDVSDRLDQFDRQARQLPGPAEPQHRLIMVQLFGDLVNILPLLEGPDADATFRQQVRLIESTQDQLTALPANLPSEPLIGTGLRAAYNALEDMFTQQFSDQTEMPKPLNSLGDKLDALDTAHDAANRQLVADGVHLMATIMRQMDTVLAQRLQEPIGPATRPATQPSTQR